MHRNLSSAAAAAAHSGPSMSPRSDRKKNPHPNTATPPPPLVMKRAFQESITTDAAEFAPGFTPMTATPPAMLPFAGGATGGGGGGGHAAAPASANLYGLPYDSVGSDGGAAGTNALYRPIYSTPPTSSAGPAMSKTSIVAQLQRQQHCEEVEYTALHANGGHVSASPPTARSSSAPTSYTTAATSTSTSTSASSSSPLSAGAGAGAASKVSTLDRPPPLWYRGGITSEAGDAAVLGCMHGDFVVRDSSRKGGGYVLTANDSGKAISYKIVRSLSNPGMVTFAGQAFATLDEVIAFMRLHPLKSCVRAGERLQIAQPAIVAPWFVRSMPRRECEAIVRKARHGEFLVRMSSTGDKYVLVVNDRGNPYTFSILVAVTRAAGGGGGGDGGGGGCDGGVCCVTFGGLEYPNVPALCEALRTTPFNSVTTRSMRLAGSARTAPSR